MYLTTSHQETDIYQQYMLEYETIVAIWIMIYLSIIFVKILSVIGAMK